MSVRKSGHILEVALLVLMFLYYLLDFHSFKKKTIFHNKVAKNVQSQICGAVSQKRSWQACARMPLLFGTTGFCHPWLAVCRNHRGWEWQMGIFPWGRNCKHQKPQFGGSGTRILCVSSSRCWLAWRLRTLPLAWQMRRGSDAALSLSGCDTLGNLCNFPKAPWLII